MRVRTLLTLTAMVAMAVGAVIVYLVLTVPNDLEAAALMRTARRQIAAGDAARGRESLERIVQQYPRTDAAAAATVALSSLGENEQQKMRADIVVLHRQSDAQEKQISALSGRLDELAARPVPQPAVAPPAPRPAARRPVSHHRHRR